MRLIVYAMGIFSLKKQLIRNRMRSHKKIAYRLPGYYMASMFETRGILYQYFGHKFSHRNVSQKDTGKKEQPEKNFLVCLYHS